MKPKGKKPKPNQNKNHLENNERNNSLFIGGK